MFGKRNTSLACLAIGAAGVLLLGQSAYAAADSSPNAKSLSGEYLSMTAVEWFGLADSPWD